MCADPSQLCDDPHETSSRLSPCARHQDEVQLACPLGHTTEFPDHAQWGATTRHNWRFSWCRREEFMQHYEFFFLEECGTVDQCAKRCARPQLFVVVTNHLPVRGRDVVDDAGDHIVTSTDDRALAPRTHGVSSQHSPSHTSTPASASLFSW